MELAFLEHLQPDLAGAAARLVDAGCTSITVAPIFLGQGGHVRRDVPELVDALRARLPQIDVRLASAAGVIDALADYCVRALGRPR